MLTHTNIPDRIIVSGIRFHARHGASRLEREIGVRYSVTLEMSKDLDAAIASDSLAATVDYSRVHATVLDVARSNSFQLMETLAGHLATRLLADFAIDEIRIQIRKETPVLDGIVDWVGVELVRRRQEGTGSHSSRVP